jgi:hypothetical protein
LEAKKQQYSKTQEVMKFLVDECLQPDLVSLAHRVQYAAISVRDLGMCGTKDWDIAAYVIENDCVLVTHNSKDFRDTNGSPGYLTKEQLHPGLICLNSDKPMTPELQMDLFETALQFLLDNAITDLMNQVIEIDYIGDDLNIQHYDAPAP